MVDWRSSLSACCGHAGCVRLLGDRPPARRLLNAAQPATLVSTGRARLQLRDHADAYVRGASHVCIVGGERRGEVKAARRGSSGA